MSGFRGELEQIQMLLEYASIQTTERYLGTKQDLVSGPTGREKPRSTPSKCGVGYSPTALPPGGSKTGQRLPDAVAAGKFVR
jgi:hypothetical protein